LLRENKRTLPDWDDWESEGQRLERAVDIVRDGKGVVERDIEQFERKDLPDIAC